MRWKVGVVGRRVVVLFVVLGWARVGIMGAEVVACMGGLVLLSLSDLDGVVGCRSAAEVAWMALRFAGPGVSV